MVNLIGQTTQPIAAPAIGAVIGLGVSGAFIFFILKMARMQWRLFKAQAEAAERSKVHMAAMEEKMDRLIGVLERRANG